MMDGNVGGKRRRLALSQPDCSHYTANSDGEIDSVPSTASSSNASSSDSLTRDASSAPTNEGIIMLENNSAILKAYDPDTRQWYRLQEITSEINILGTSVVTTRDRLFVLMYDKSVYCLDLSDMSKGWTEMSSMNDYHDIAAVELNGFIYMIGSERDLLRNCERYDISENAWTMIPTIDRVINGYIVAAAKGCVYAIGGRNATNAVSTVERFDPTAHNWSHVSRMHTARSTMLRSSAVSLQNKLYVIDAWKIEFYDPDIDIWTVISPLQTFHIIKACSVNGKIYAVGQGVRSGHLSALASLDLEWAEWRIMEKLTNVNNFHDLSWVSVNLLPLQITVRLGAEEIIFDKQLLREKSDYFKAMFSHDMIENRHNLVEMRHGCPEHIKRCMDYIRFEELPEVTENNVEELLDASAMLLLEDLKGHIVDYLRQTLSTETFARTRPLAYKYDLIHLEDFCDEFALRNFEALAETECFVKMEVDYILFLISSKKLKVSSGSTVYNAMMRWINSNRAVREVHFNKLFSRLNIMKVPIDFIRTVMETETLVNSSKKCRFRINASLKKRSQEFPVLLAIDTYTSTWKVFIPQRKIWKLIREIPKLDGETSVLTAVLLSMLLLGDYVYAIFQNLSFYKIKYKDPDAEWVPLANINTCQQPPMADADSTNTNLSAVVFNGCIYVFSKNIAAKYNPESDKWTPIVNLTVKLDYSLVAANGSIYAIGGKDDVDSVSNTVIRYSPADDAWKYDVPPMLVARSKPAAVEYKGRIYVMGGQGDGGQLSYTEAYDPSADLWSPLAQMHAARANFRACILDGKIYAVAGNQRFRQSIEYLDDDRNDWIIKRFNKMEVLKNSVVPASLSYEVLFNM